MAYKQLFIDSDVFLDLFLTRNPFYAYTQFLLLEGTSLKFKLTTSALVIANLNYILTKKLGGASARKSIKELINLVKVLPFESDIIENVLASTIADFEDAIQIFIAQKYGCDLIVTRNIKNYKQSTIPVLTPEQFLRTL